jgi:hypothetical protein
VVSSDANVSATVVLYNGGPKGFINEYLGGPLSATLVGVFPNGSVYNIKLPATTATFSREDHGSFATSAVYENTGFSFNGTTLRGGRVQYVVKIDAPQIGVSGTMTLESVAPAHYPCGPDSAGQKELVLPHVYWSNAIPDAVGAVNLVINGTAINFAGAGYHDKNWGDTPFLTVTSTWYWGHAQVGPYSIVWFDVFDQAGVEYQSGYVARDGKILRASCAPGSVVARPWGLNSEFPPKISTPAVQGMEVQFDLGHGRTFWANVTTTVPAVAPTGGGVYFRSLGTVTGGISGKGCDKGSPTYEGVSLFEEFKLTP